MIARPVLQKKKRQQFHSVGYFLITTRKKNKKNQMRQERQLCEVVLLYDVASYTAQALTVAVQRLRNGTSHHHCRGAGASPPCPRLLFYFLVASAGVCILAPGVDEVTTQTHTNTYFSENSASTTAP